MDTPLTRSFGRMRGRPRRGRQALAAGVAGLACACTLAGPAPQGDAHAAAPATGATTATVDDPRLPVFGAVYHGMWGDITWAERAELLGRLETTGVRWVRLGVQWSLVQPRRPTRDDPGFGGWGVDRLDRVIAMARRHGLRISVTFHRTPAWANGGRGPEYLPDRPGAYARAARWVAHRYRHQVDSWEVWNEPNHPNHLAGADARGYTRLLCRAYPAFHRGDPGTTVVFGGTAGNDWEFIRSAYRYGAKGCFDVLATHPYNSNHPPGYGPLSDHRWWFGNVRLVRQVMVRRRDARTPIWFTEVGWSVHRNTPSTPSWERGVTARQQARYAVQMLRITAREFPYVRRVAWYAARDERTGNLEKDNFGLFTLDLQPKPSARALRELLSTPR